MLEQPSRAQLHDCVAAMKRVYVQQAASWSRDSDASAFTRLGAPSWNPNVLAFARRDNHGNTVAVVCNFSGAPINGFELTLPEQGVWREILNTDAAAYGGSGVGNPGVVHAEESGRAVFSVPPLG